MEIRIICLGKIKNQHLVALIKDYIDKINVYHKLSIIELNEITFKQESIENIKESLIQEYKIIKPYLENSYNIALSIEAKLIDSIQISKEIENIFNFNSHFKYLNFIIGSSYGLDDKIKQTVQQNWSFGRITLNHQLMRLVLLEQIYRAFCIIKNIKYHK